MVKWRRCFHENPELGGNERDTSKMVAYVLRELGIKVIENVGCYGVVGLIESGKTGPTLALRADMDALPIEEENAVEYRSKVWGVMHACGHDAHMAILLGTAKQLLGLRDQFRGNIKLIFQPAEECLPCGGSMGMIKENVLDNPQVDAMIALHISPYLPVGQVSIPEKYVMAAGDIFDIVIHGLKVHAATPHLGFDTIVAAAQAVLELQTIISRKLDATETGVISVCGVSGGDGYNIMPEEVMLKGTVRFTNPEYKDFFETKIRQVLNGICAGFGGTYELNYQHGYPPTLNNSRLVTLVDRIAGGLLGEENVTISDKPAMMSDDIARFFEIVPGCYFWLGTKNEDNGIVYPLHSPKFDIDENILSIGSTVLIQSCLQYLNCSQDKGDDLCPAC